MRTNIGTSHKALLISLCIAAGLVGCGGPPENTTATSDDPIVPLSKDPSVPLLIIARKQGGETWLPIKVVSISNEQCGPNIPSYSGHTTCRKKGQPIRWFAQDEATHENPGPGVNFTITFKDPNKDPVETENGGQCKSSVSGALDCKIKNNATTDYGYLYTVTMSGGALDPRIYVNP